MHRIRLTAAAVALLLPIAAAAQEPDTTKAPPSFDEVQATIRRMQERLDRLGSSAAQRDQALQFLEQQVEKASGEIAGTGKTNESLRGEAASLADRMDDLSQDRERLRGEVGERGEAVTLLEKKLSDLSAELDAAATRESILHANLATAQAGAGQSQAALAAKAAEADALRQKLAELQSSRDALGLKVADLEKGAGESEKLLTERLTETERLQAELAAVRRGAEEATHRAAIQVAAAEGAAAALQRKVESLTQEVTDLDQQLATAESTVDEQRDKIDGLDQELEQALAKRVEELEQYRSEFFGGLKKALGDRPDLRVVGDRFVFQSELLFASGSARLDPDGQAELRALARTLQDVTARIPSGIDWVLRVDGHTDRQPIRDGSFHSNWELSAARAISVIEFLVAQGIAPEHLAAAGFGEYRPIDPADDEIAYRRNRRIEFKLTEG